MEKLKKLQLPFIIFQSVLLVILFLQYQNIVGKNSVLKSKVAEGIVVLNNISKSINTVDENFRETVREEAAFKVEVVNLNTETAPSKTNGNTITEIETSQESHKTKTIPFEFQEVDFEWATLLETTVSDAFITSLLLEKFSLKNVECRSSTCEVRMSKGQDDTFHQSVLVLFALEELGINHHTFKVSPETDDDTVVFYFDKYESD